MKCIKLYLNDAHHTEWLAARCKTYMARLVHHPETHEYKLGSQGQLDQYQYAWQSEPEVFVSCQVAVVMSQLSICSRVATSLYTMQFLLRLHNYHHSSLSPTFLIWDLMTSVPGSHLPNLESLEPRQYLSPRFSPSQFGESTWDQGYMSIVQCVYICGSYV